MRDLRATIASLPGKQSARQIVERVAPDIEAARDRGVTWAELARAIGGVSPTALSMAWSRYQRRTRNHQAGAAGEGG